MKYRTFDSLSDDELCQVVTDMFGPVQIKGINRSNEERIDFMMLLSGEDQTWDRVILCNPFEYGENAIMVDNLSVTNHDYQILKKFCFAKGIVNIDWITDNPYLKEE